MSPTLEAIKEPTLVAAPEARPGNLLEIDPEVFQQNFDRTPYLLRHNLVGHPLFELPSLIELARRMPEEYVEYNAGNIPVNQEYYLTPRTGLSVEETIRRIEECCSWMVIKRCEKDPVYRDLLMACIEEIKPHSEKLRPGLYEEAGAIFIASPNAVTPYHIDHEYNFLLQIRGRKDFHIFDAWDREALPEESLEAYFTGDKIARNMFYTEEFQRRAYTFDLRQGWGVHVPSCAPHWVKNSNEVSISFSVAYYTSVSDRQHFVHAVNHRLRRLGLKPRPYGQSAWVDAAKSLAFRGGRLSGRVLDRARSLIPGGRAG